MSGFQAEAREARDFLAAHPDVEFFEMFFTSLTGVPRGKRLRRSEVMKLYEGSAFLPGSIVAVDILGADCEDTGMVWETGDADRIACAVPGGIVPAPWIGEDAAQVMCSLHDLGGEVTPFDPRAVLQRVLDRYAADGLTPMVACEMEFYLVESRRGRVSLRSSPFTRRKPVANEAHGLPETEDAADFLRALWKAADAQGVPVEGASSEASPGQLELTLHHKADALAAGDDAVLFKRMAKGVARPLGCEATFMAKPFAEIAGSGMHIHMSMLDANCANIFASDAAEGTEQLRHAIGGMAQTMADAMAVLAPNANSFRRYVARSYAPVSPTWGVNNRTVALRIPAGSAASRRVEHRVAGADANPYLALAVVLAGAHYGLTNKLDPGAMTHGDGYSAPVAAGDPLPTDWLKAIDRFAASSVMSEYLGDAFVDLYATVKRTEQARFNAVVTSLDHDWYLQNA
ncbi:glutamine synthetase [Sphingomonas sp. CGMCC 1.13654]|uniref:Glutamine synthetase n=1 Tax=Sphingomonas chungangi TaxID=2683589 RepID=A0A838LD94_9SPHN|nr:glutamine synthetase family protein [Sphingomonas chungangi]MBA2936106.1 glutamine synthetase [Sphingomonas chungangi]MVW55493.1 glutamine synthetase [Sphingomonas chungangi]